MATLVAGAALLLVTAAAGATNTAFDEGAEVRRAVERAFQQLRAGDYNSLYDALPASAQRRVTRERFVRGLEKSRGMYELERMEFGEVHVSGDVAVAETTLYGRIRRPLASEGKITARQYLVREGNVWRVAAGDRATQKQILADHPAFARRHPARAPRIYVKTDGRWVDVSALAARRGK